MIFPAAANAGRLTSDYIEQEYAKSYYYALGLRILRG